MTSELHADAITWTLSSVHPLSLSDNDIRRERELWRELWSLTISQLVTLTAQLDASRQTIRHLRRQGHP